MKTTILIVVISVAILFAGFYFLSKASQEAGAKIEKQRQERTLARERLGH